MAEYIFLGILVFVAIIFFIDSFRKARKKYSSPRAERSRRLWENKTITGGRK